jgi:hypothetical protein
MPNLTGIISFSFFINKAVFVSARRWEKQPSRRSFWTGGMLFL